MGLGLRIEVRNRALPTDGRLVVGVNSFGFGGANAHTVLASAPPVLPPGASTAPPEGLPVLVSARTEPALAEAVRRMTARLASAAPREFYDIAYTSCRRRGKHEHRAVVLAHSTGDAERGFTALATTDEASTSLQQKADGVTHSGGAAAVGGWERGAGAPAAGASAKAVERGRVVFVFCGNGSQWAGMGTDLLAGDSIFRETVNRVDAALAPLLGWSAAEALAAPPEQWCLDLTERAQPLLFTLQVALAAVLRERGIEPAMVLGHSVGEVAAAHCAGALTLAQAALVIAERSRLQGATRGGGRMAAVGLSAERAAERLSSFGGRLEIAGVNSPQDVTIAGDPQALADLGRQLTGQAVFFRELDLDYAFHSSSMDSLAEPLGAALAALAPSPAAVALHSTVTGARAGGTDLDAAYWWQNVRRPVRFSAAVEQALDDGGDILLEIGPHPVLQTYLRRIAATRPRTAVTVLGTLRRDGDGATQLATTHAALLAAGADIDWGRYFPRPGQVTGLPAYPWQRERHWEGTRESWISSSGDGVLRHPLLGERLPAPLPVWQGPIEPVLLPWLGDHRVAGSVVMPATGFVEMALAAGRAVCAGPVEVEHLDLSHALVIPWADPSSVRVQLSLSPDDGTVSITSTNHGPGRAADAARPHARARVRALLRDRPESLDLNTVRERCPRLTSADEHYTACAAAGLAYGPGFQVLRELRVGEGEVLATYHHSTPGDPYTAHPALLDGALQAGAPLLAGLVTDGHACLPVSIGAVRLWGTLPETGVVRVRERTRTTEEVCWDITLTDQDGVVTAELDGCRLRRLAVTARAGIAVYHTVLRAAPHSDLPCEPSPLPPPRTVQQAAADRIAELRSDWRRFGHERFVPLFKECSARSIGTTLAAVLPEPSAPFELDDLVAAGMQPRFRRLVSLLIPLFVRHGVLVCEPDGRWRLTAAEFPVDQLVRQIATELPAFVTETALGTHRWAHLEQVLRGRTDPVELLGSEPVAKALEQLHDTAPVSRFHNRLTQALLREMLRDWPVDRPLRVLEIGAGTGGTTAALLPLLPAQRTRYCFTDVSPLLFPRAQKRFAAYDFVDYRVLDLDADPLGQGYPQQGFDVVVAVDSLYMAKDLTAALHRVAALLAPGGQLLIGESHDPEMLALSLGTPDSFHTGTDTELRPDFPLLSREQWPALLERCGYRDIVQTGHDRKPTRDHRSVLLAGAPTPESAAPPALPTAPAGAVFVIASETVGQDPLVHALADTLTAADAATVRVIRAEAEPSAWDRALSAATAPPETGLSTPVIDSVDIALLLGGSPHNEPSSQNDPADQVVQATRHTELLRVVTAACARLPREVGARLWLVTRTSGAVPALARITDPVHAAAWGVARCLANEHPDLDGRRICLEPGADPVSDARRLARELLGPGTEDEVVLTAGGRFVPREQHRPVAGPTREAVPFALRSRNPGLSYNLSWEEVRRPQPGPGEVVIEVRAATLNYRDLMQVTGLLPAAVIEGTPSESGLGLECAGVVTACGSGVTGLRPGDRVAGMAAASLSSHTVARASHLWPIPAGLSYDEAATTPVALATVVYSLFRLARIQPGETVLVHGAAGGVGLAAVQYARAHGATVIATAGSDLKRAYLHALGIDHVLDSRSLDFTDQVLQITAHRGVDIVLNSLAGEAITRSLELLRPGGRFLELGKRDIHENKPLLLRPFGNNIAFFGVDLNAILDVPREIDLVVAEVGRLLREGRCHPLPHAAFPAARVADAFRLIQHSRHIGKVVVTFSPLDEPPAVERITRTPTLDPQATYLVSGGLGGFGAATAGWLAGLGARHLALVGRRGTDSPEAGAILSALADRGVTATAFAADTTDPETMRAVVAAIDADGHPLRGVVHCAMHLDDDALVDLDEQRIAAVLKPKIGGAAVLDALTRDRDCDLFLLYSSGSAMVGNLRQSTYAAANLYLEALVRRRRQEGRSGLAIAWGAISETGYVTRNNLTEALSSLGIEQVRPTEAFTAAERLLDARAVVAGVGRYNWAKAGAILKLATSPRMTGLAPACDDQDGVSRTELIRGLAGEQPLVFLTKNLTELLGAVLQMDPEQFDPHRRLDAYGLDSLMAAELLISLQQRYGVDIPPMELLRGNATIADIAQLVQLRLGLGPAPDGSAADFTAVTAPVPREAQPSTNAPVLAALPFPQQPPAAAPNGAVTNT
ncbi:SDR family NAD(P)-dependent oxidoreductase [Kitasatospora sp. NPDC088160]|uniref:SDR family NAD(P)-dependent oxidoreductase n=1 Tax=Kitasatospora sp. NPDC088160 TaxID=3364072 RepID=UPI0038241DBA